MGRKPDCYVVFCMSKLQRNIRVLRSQEPKYVILVVVASLKTEAERIPRERACAHAHNVMVGVVLKLQTIVGKV